MPTIAFVVTTFGLLAWLAHAKQTGDTLAVHRIGWLVIALAATAGWTLFHMPLKVVVLLVIPTIIIKTSNRYFREGVQRWVAIIASSAALLLLIPLGFGTRIIPLAIIGLVLQVRSKENDPSQPMKG